MKVNRCVLVGNNHKIFLYSVSADGRERTGGSLRIYGAKINFFEFYFYIKTKDFKDENQDQKFFKKEKRKFCIIS